MLKPLLGRFLLTALLAALLATLLHAVPRVRAEPAAAAETPLELGAVKWLRDLDAGAKVARERDRALLVLFQEVPGWGTCKRYGGQVLTHPLLVDAIETLFVPVAIYNNTQDDRDARTREAFEEPAWNNPVVRIVDADTKDIVPRHAGDYSLAGLLGAMTAALETQGRGTPPWLTLLAREAASRKSGFETAVFGMTWFWVGEARLASIEGVVATRPGWLEKKEVVEVQFDPQIVSYESLVKRAAEGECAAQVFTRSDVQQKTGAVIAGERAMRSDGEVRMDDDKFNLSRTPLKHVPLTPLQASRINTLVGEHEDPSSLLAPAQRALLARIRATPDAGWESAIGVDFHEAWRRAAERD